MKNARNPDEAGAKRRTNTLPFHAHSRSSMLLPSYAGQRACAIALKPTCVAPKETRGEVTAVSATCGESFGDTCCIFLGAARTATSTGLGAQNQIVTSLPSLGSAHSRQLLLL